MIALDALNRRPERGGGLRRELAGEAHDVARHAAQTIIVVLLAHGVHDTTRLATGRAVTLADVSKPSSAELYAHLQGLVGETILTVTRFENTILNVDDTFAYVFTDRTDEEKYPDGDKVPIQWVEQGAETLYSDGVVVLDELPGKFRSAFIGAVLLTLPNTVGRTDPARVELTASESETALPQLDVDRVYSWEELADVFGFKAGYFSVAGGMVPSTATGSLLLITHPEGGKSFNYGDYWDGERLIYTGKGKVGDQQRTGQNLDVAENRRPLFVFEGAGPRQLRFLGRARKIEERTARAPDDKGDMRDVFRFRLEFGDGTAPARRPPSGTSSRTRRPKPRPFDPDRPPPRPPESRGESANPEETAAKQEQANTGHHAILVSLYRNLAALGCTDIEDKHGAIDLWATRPDGVRVIFEAKTITSTNEVERTRAGLAQLYEYRLLDGAPEDELCLVVNRALTVRRLNLLDELGVAVLEVSGSDLAAGNDLGTRLIDQLTA